jgi:nitroreductase
MIKELIAKNRSCRRFYQDIPIGLETLRELVDLARLSSSPWNLQPLKFFRHLGWAARMKDWPGPSEGERPSAYIVVLGDPEISKNIRHDQVIAGMSILLGATERGLGGCMLGALKREAALYEELGIPTRYKILLVVGLGKRKETAVIEPVPADGDTAYWTDSSGVHHVPKRSLKDIIIGEL